VLDSIAHFEAEKAKEIEAGKTVTWTEWFTGTGQGDHQILPTGQQRYSWSQAQGVSILLGACVRDLFGCYEGDLGFEGFEGDFVCVWCWLKHTHARAHARTRARTHTHTHTPGCKYELDKTNRNTDLQNNKMAAVSNTIVCSAKHTIYLRVAWHILWGIVRKGIC